jgi:translation initiation factor IF-1
MPQHNTATQSKQRSAVTGRQLGKRAAKAEGKVAEGVVKFLDLVERTATAKFWPEQVKAEPKAIPGQSEGFMLGRVIRGYGAGRLEVRLFSGEVVSAPVAGRIAFRGHAATKTDREACMCSGDYIVVDGLQAAGKMRVAIAKRIAALYQSANPRLAPPKEFFDESAEADQGFDFDRSEEEGEDELLAAAGGGGGAELQRVGRPMGYAAEAKEEAPVDVDAL